MKLPRFFKKVVVEAELDIVVERGPVNGFRIMADRDDDVLVHRWSSVNADELKVYNSVTDALEDMFGDEDDFSIDEFLASSGGPRFDGRGNPIGTALRAEDARIIREWIADEE